MSGDYWETFQANAHAMVAARVPHGWKVTKVEAWDDRVVATFEWAEDHSMVVDVHSRSGADDALQEILKVIDGYRR
jgi:hypothetical protein